VSPNDRTDVDISQVRFVTADGVELTGDLAEPATCRAAAIVCHPHPQYGGNRYNNVVEAIFGALPGAGVGALRFDFRREFGGGIDERLDAIAALDHLHETHLERPLFAIGYSFGAMVALSLTDDRLHGKALVAPPLGVMDGAPAMDTPTLVLSPVADQFAPPDVARPIVADWPSSVFEVVESTDHFLTGRTAIVAQRIVEWIDDRLAD
jgi:uncharacterized protein